MECEIGRSTSSYQICTTNFSEDTALPGFDMIARVWLSHVVTLNRDANRVPDEE
jgi:hypothetical protein